MIEFSMLVADTPVQGSSRPRFVRESPRRRRLPARGDRSLNVRVQSGPQREAKRALAASTPALSASREDRTARPMAAILATWPIPRGTERRTSIKPRDHRTIKERAHAQPLRSLFALRIRLTSVLRIFPFASEVNEFLRWWRLTQPDIANVIAG